VATRSASCHRLSFSLRTRGGTGPPSLRTGQADLPHPLASQPIARWSPKINFRRPVEPREQATGSPPVRALLRPEAGRVRRKHCGPDEPDNPVAVLPTTGRRAVPRPVPRSCYSAKALRHELYQVQATNEFVPATSTSFHEKGVHGRLGHMTQCQLTVAAVSRVTSGDCDRIAAPSQSTPLFPFARAFSIRPESPSRQLSSTWPCNGLTVQVTAWIRKSSVPQGSHRFWTHVRFGK
jgi:hypothetical protein